MGKQRKPVGIWVRVSTDMQAKGESPGIQEQRTRQFVESRGWDVAEVYRLEGVSGAISLEHAEAKRMLKDVEAGRIQALVATRFARVARDGVMFRLLHRKMKSFGAELLSLDENIDTSTPAGELMLGFMADLAEMERKEVSSRVRASVKPRAEKGKSLGGSAPFGFQYVDGKLELDPVEAPIRRLIHELYIEHRRKSRVANILNERGLKPRKGGKWAEATIDWLLRDPAAKGFHRKNYLQSNGPGQRWSFKEGAEVIHHPIPAIVSAQVWDEAYAILTAQAKANARTPKQAKHLFTGLIACGCGAKMYARADSAKYVCAKCHRKVETATVEEAFVRHLKNHKVTCGEVADYLENSDEALLDKQELLRSCETKAKQLEREIKAAVSLHEKGKLDEIAFARVTEPLQTQLRRVEAEIPRLRREVESLKQAQPKPESLLKEDSTLADIWRGLDFEGRREMVESLVSQVIAEKGERLIIELVHLRAGK